MNYTHIYTVICLITSLSLSAQQYRHTKDDVLAAVEQVINELYKLSTSELEEIV